MSTLKQLRLRINGVKSTQKITKTMRMVAAAKLIKAQEKKEKFEEYANKIYRVVARLINSVSLDSEVASLLTGNGKNHTHLLVVFGSDKGLCGSFNSSLAKKLKSQIEALESEKKHYKIICFGKKVFDQIKHLYKNSIIKLNDGVSSVDLSYVKAQELATTIISLFNKQEFDVCIFIYNEFKNALKQTVTAKRLIPLDSEIYNYDEANYIYEYEPNETLILEHILPLNLSTQIFYILLESVASEYGSRMTAMESATNNAKDMINKLTLIYNRSRQAAITKELIEIISSAEIV